MLRCAQPTRNRHAGSTNALAADKRQPDLCSVECISLFLSVAEADDISVDVFQPEIARPRHIFQFLSDASARFAAATEKLVHIIIDVTVNADSKGTIASVLGEEETQLTPLDANAQWQSGRELVLRHLAEAEA